MASVQWVKIEADIFDNRKIKRIRRQPSGDSMVLLWVLLLTLAGKSNDFGRIWLTHGEPYTADDICVDYGFPLRVVEDALDLFESLNMIEFENGCIVVSDWEQHQNVETLERIREQNRERKRRFDEKKKESNVTDALPVTLPVTLRNATDKNRIDKNRKDIDKNIDTPTRHKYGAYNNVLLSDDDLEKLKSEFPDWENRIERLSEYIAAKGVKYKSHLAVIRNWARRDKENAKVGGNHSGIGTEFGNIGTVL